MTSVSEIKDTPVNPSGTEPLVQPQPVVRVHKTTGEKWFDGLRFATGEGVILGITAVLAYVSKYGKDSYLGVPNVLKTSEQWMTKKLMPVDKENQFRVRLAGAIASTTVLMHGGNLFVPVMKGMQNHKPGIVEYFNRKLGKPGEVEEGNDRLRHQTPEGWGDIIKGRLASWAVVFTSLFGADMIAGTDKNGMRRFDKYEAEFGKMVAGVTDKGKEIIGAFPKDTPMTKEFAQTLEKNSKTFRLGKILALDVFATTAALAIWSSVSKLSAIMRSKKGSVSEEAGRDLIAHEKAAETAKEISVPASEIAASEKQISHAARMGDRPVDYRGLAEREPTSSGMAIS